MSVTISAGPFLTVYEVATLLRVSRMTVYRLVSTKQLPATKVGHSVRIAEDDLNRYLAEQRI